MEKLVYVLWRRSIEPDAFARDLVADVGPALVASGARFVTVSVVDEAVAAGATLRIGSMDPPKDAVVTFWLEESFRRAEAEAMLVQASADQAGYLVAESRPLRTPPERQGPPGGRTDGFHLVTCIRKRPDLSHDEFIAEWHGPFRDTAIDGQDTFDYVRNEVVRPLTPDAPDWSAVVEEGFPAGALADPAVFFDAVGDPDRLAAQQTRMFEGVQRFLDLAAVESHPMSRYVFESGPG
ncbi:MAG: EthD domain-containing protein [Acidimicrobiia bacterium]|nr:EthD domain-containing protein [Acidimicrobiia bacterium]